MVERPFFRTDLVSQPIDEQGSTFVEVTDPDSGATFRFYEVEYAVACAMDGQRDIESLASWAREELGLEPSREEIARVVSTLEELGYVEELGARAMPPSPGAAVEPEAGEPAAEKPTPPEPIPEPVAPEPAPPEPPAAQREPSDDEVALGAPGRSPIDQPAASAAPAAGDVDLGAPGKSPLDGERKPAPTSEEVELGMAGGSSESGAEAGASSAAGVPDDVFEIGQEPPAESSRGAGEEDVSVDLSQHLEIGRDDVKEAVRQSKAMPVPEVPKELADELGGDEKEAPPVNEPAPKAAVPAEKPAADEPAAPKKPQAPLVPPEKQAAADKAAEAKAAREEASPAAASPAPEEASSTGPMLWFLIFFLLIVIAGAGYYWFFYRTGSTTVGEPAPSAPAQGAGQGAAPSEEADEPAEPPKPTATLEVAFQEKVLSSPGAGRVAWLAEAGSEVEKGAAVAKLAGFKRFERKLEYDRKRLEVYQARLDKAAAAGNKRKMRAAEVDVRRKEEAVAEAKAALEKLVATAPIAGTVEPLVEEGATVEKDGELVRITGQGGPEAMFEVEDPDAYAPGESVEVSLKEDPAVSAECGVAEIDGARVTVACPENTGLQSGANVELR